MSEDTQEPTPAADAVADPQPESPTAPDALIPDQSGNGNHLVSVDPIIDAQLQAAQDDSAEAVQTGKQSETQAIEEPTTETVSTPPEASPESAAEIADAALAEAVAEPEPEPDSEPEPQTETASAAAEPQEPTPKSIVSPGVVIVSQDPAIRSVGVGDQTIPLDRIKFVESEPEPEVTLDYAIEALTGLANKVGQDLLGLERSGEGPATKQARQNLNSLRFAIDELKALNLTGPHAGGE